jgi:multiple sugar transport system substrate-binding protein
MKKFVAFAATLALAAGIAQAKTTVQFYTFTSGGSHQKDLDGLISVFEKQNPDIEIKYVVAPFDTYFTKLQTDVAAGNAPDVYELNYENFVTFASKGVLRSLTSLISRDKEKVAELFYPAALNAFKHRGVQYGLPMTFSTVVLYYNKDLFDKAGVAYPTANWTWQDELAAAKKLTDPSKRIWGTYQEIQFWEFYKVSAQFGGGVKVSPLVQIDTAKNREALQMMVDRIRVNKVMPTDAELSGMGNVDLFFNGQVAMLHTGIWMFDMFSKAKFNWDIAVEPGAANKATHFFSNAAVISSTSKNPDAAYKWVKFISSSPVTAQKRIETGWELPALSLNQRGAVDAYLKQPLPANREAVFESLKYAVTPPVVDSQPQLQDIMNEELKAAQLGTKTVAQALASAEKRVKALLKK